jgi:uncharacterized protein YjbI with pentapeptide repeats/uncharacterized protein
MAGLGVSILLSFAAAVAPPTDSCIARAGAVTGEGSTLPMSIPGDSLKKSYAIEKIRKKAKDGRTIVIEGGDFTDYDFRKAKLSNVCFRGAKLTNTDWSGANMIGMGFIDSDLSGAVFTGAIIRGTLFRTTTMANVDATAADFSQGQLDGGWNASIKNLKLDLAKMNGFKFICGTRAIDGCPFDRQGISARNTDFSGVLFSGFALWGANVSGAIFDGADMNVDDVGQIVGGAEPSVVSVRHRNMSTLVDGPVAMALAGALATTNTTANQCANPQRPLETALCEDKTGSLRAFDSDIVRLAASSAPEKKKNLIAFERGREACLAGPMATKTACLTTIYRARRNSLLAAIAPMTWMKRAGRILFSSNDLALTSGATLQPSWPGIAQVLVRLSPSYMLARVEGSKRVMVRATATDGNEAACSLDVAATAASAGNFTVPVVLPPKMRPGARVAPPTATEITVTSTVKRKPTPTPLFRVVGEQAILIQAQDDGTAPVRIPVCNGAAAFGAMRRLPIDEMTFETLWASMKPVTPAPVATATSSAPAPVATGPSRP